MGYEPQDRGLPTREARKILGDFGLDFDIIVVSAIVFHPFKIGGNCLLNTGVDIIASLSMLQIGRNMVCCPSSPKSGGDI